MILETQELFPKVYFTHKPIYAYLPLFISSWNMQKHWDWTYFASVTAEYVEVFRHFCVLYKSARTCHFFYCTYELLFSGASFEPIKNLATSCAQKLQGFHGTPLHHYYFLSFLSITPYQCQMISLCLQGHGPMRECL